MLSTLMINSIRTSTNGEGGLNAKALLATGAILALFSFSACAENGKVLEHSVLKEKSCDWLHEIKRTNTWFERDQAIRIEAHKLQDNKRKGMPVTDQQVSEAIEAVAISDRMLQSELDDLVARCDWPTTSGYGESAPKYAAMIVQHADLPYQEKYLPIMQAAAKSGELPPRFVATLTDRILMRKKLPQRYGSQLTDESGILAVYSIEDPQHVDERRAEAGMIPASFCAYISMFTPRPQTNLCDTPKPLPGVQKNKKKG